MLKSYKIGEFFNCLFFGKKYSLKLMKLAFFIKFLFISINRKDIFNLISINASR